jgi:hypothetical protein
MTGGWKSQLHKWRRFPRVNLPKQTNNTFCKTCFADELFLNLFGFKQSDFLIVYFGCTFGLLTFANSFRIPSDART